MTYRLHVRPWACSRCGSDDPNPGCYVCGESCHCDTPPPVDEPDDDDATRWTGEEELDERREYEQD